MINLDVLIFGGGAAGLWTLDRLRRAGFHAILLEANRLGAGQTIAAQGIIHGGGKYALRGVRDFEAVKVIREMPARWTAHLEGRLEPDLSEVLLHSRECMLWLPTGAGFGDRSLMFMIDKAGLLSTKPVPVPEAQWPDALRESASSVFSMAEPVIETGALVRTLAGRHQGRVFKIDAPPEFSKEGVAVAGTLLTPRVSIFAAGTGNEDLLRRAGLSPEIAQQRPLCMTLLRGPLPRLFGHCISGGKTAITVTSVPAAGTSLVWQVGGEIAEHEPCRDPKAHIARVIPEIRRCLPGLDLSKVEYATYAAARAESRTKDHRRPSGVHVSRVAQGVVVAWPTKLALAPVLADEIFESLSVDLKEPGRYDGALPPWPAPEVAPYPWENASWSPVP